MSPAAFHFRRLVIHRAPGFPREGFEVGPFSPGINLVHGPNASGKSTTASALAALLWPPKPLPVTLWLAAEGELDGASCQLTLEASRYAFVRQGAEGPPPGLPAPEIGSRYLLSLDRLLAAEQEPLAAELARESAGGLDVRRAATVAGFKARASPARETPAELDKLERRIRELEAEHLRLERHEDELARLHRELDQARLAAEEAQRLEAQLSLGAARLAREQAHRVLAELPAWLELAKGDEDARLASLDERLRLAERQIRAAEADLATLHGRLAHLSATGAPDETRLAECEAEVARLAEAEREAGLRRRELAAAEAGWRRAASDLGEPLDAERLERAARAVPAELAELVRAEENLTAARALAERAGALLTSRQAADPAHLAMARQLLQRWLATPGGGSALWGLAVVLLSAGMLAAVALASSLSVPWRAATGGAALALLALGGRWLTELLERPRLARELERTGLAKPARWTRREAEARLDELGHQEAEARLAGLSRRLRDQLGLDEERLGQERMDFEQRLAEVASRLGLAPATSALSLSLLLDRSRAFFEAGQKVEAERAQLSSLEQQAEVIRLRLSAVLGAEAASTPARAAAVLQAWSAHVREAEETKRQAENLAKNLVETLRPAAFRAQNDRRQLFSGFGLEPVEPSRLITGLNQLGSYREASRALLLAERDLERATTALGSHLPAPEELPSRDELEAEHRRLVQMAQRRQDLEAQIVEINTRLADARGRRDLEQALLLRDGLRSTLAEQRAADFEAVAGWVLTQVVEDQTRNLFQPQVLERARQIFEAITRHRYELRLAFAPQPSFSALDRSTGLLLSLEALSSGTRVQLLIAVRLASIESHERGLALPLFFDEALTTSDPERSEALMAAVCAIAQTGRQVFVFTAQPEEVAKWQRVIDEASSLEAPVPRAVLDLAALRRLGESTLRPLPQALPRALPPPPAGRNRVRYGELLGVAALDPWNADLGGVHLWHLVADPEALHHLLLAGFERWGPAQALLERGAAGAVLPEAESLLAGAQARARALAGALAAWRAGRGRPVDRGTLAASGAVSDTFLDPVAALATRLGGDAARLLVALERGEVKGFRTQKVGELAASLEEQGFLDRRPRASAEEIRLAAISAAREDLEAGRIRLGDLDDLLASLPEASPETS